MTRPSNEIRVLTAVELTERLITTVESITIDYERGALQQGRGVHPVKKLDDDWDPDRGISTDNMMRLLAERIIMQGHSVVFDPNVIREKIINAADSIKRPGS